jgi:hypothetical protein
VRILSFAPVSTKYQWFVNLSVRKMRPAFAGKCMTVAVACVDSAAELVTVWRRFSFLNRSRGKCTCVPCYRKSCETYTCHCLGFGKKKNQSRRGTAFETGVVVPSVVLPRASRSWASATLSRFLVAVTMGSWPPQASTCCDPLSHGSLCSALLCLAVVQRGRFSN